VPSFKVYHIFREIKKGVSKGDIMVAVVKTTAEQEWEDDT
jgi:hypothetical protein